MKQLTLLSFLLLGTISLRAQQTKLFIIGTEHEPTSHFNADTLLNVLQKIKPDVILFELDTSLMDKQGNFKGRALTSTENEIVASSRYKKLDGNVMFRQFDIADRNSYYDRHKTFATEHRLSRCVDSLYRKNLLDKYYMQVISALYETNGAVNILSDMDMRTFNSPGFMKLTAFRQYWMYDKQLEVIANTPELKQYYSFYKDDGEFWTRRNKTMIRNIGSYLSEFNGKRIVVLTGAMHKYFLTGGLEPMQKKLNFILADLPI